MTMDQCTATGEPKAGSNLECLRWHTKRIVARAEDAERLGVPLMITEFGACLTEGPCSTEIRQVTNACDDNLAGWAYWQLKDFEDITTTAGDQAEGFYNKDGTLQDWKVKALARSYMQRTQGTPTR